MTDNAKTWKYLCKVEAATEGLIVEDYGREKDVSQLYNIVSLFLIPRTRFFLFEIVLASDS